MRKIWLAFGISSREGISAQLRRTMQITAPYQGALSLGAEARFRPGQYCAGIPPVVRCDGALAAVAAGLHRPSGALGPANRKLGPRIKAAIDSSLELQERAALKNVGLAAAMTAALRSRGVAELIAQLASELGVLALKRGFAA